MTVFPQVSTASLFQQAVGEHQAGKLAAAEAAYRRLLTHAPRHADALHLLGLVQQQLGRPHEAEILIRQALAQREEAAFLVNLGVVLKDLGQRSEAEAAYRRALELGPNSVEACNNLGLLLKEAGRFAEAEAAYRRALELNADFVEAHNNLGLLLQETERLPEAEAVYRGAMELKPDYAEAHYNLGLLFRQTGRLAEAETAWRRALELKPDYVNAYYNLGILLKETGCIGEAESAWRRTVELNPQHAPAHNNLGLLLQEDQRLPEAEAAYRLALQLKPDAAETHYNLGLLLQGAMRLPEAEAAFRRALELRPDYAEAQNDLGNLLKETDRHAAAEAAYRRALELKPDYLDAHYNYGNLLAEIRRFAEAEHAYRRALELKPDHPKSHWNLSLLLLRLGRYAEAWPSYEFRYHRDLATIKIPDLPYPSWQGESLSGKSLVIWTEQGFGDCIQSLRYAPLLKQRGLARLSVVGPPALKALLETLAGVDEVFDHVAVPLHDFWCFCFSLPLRFGTTLATIPATLPYLHAKSALVARWRQRLPGTGLKVGLVWKGRASHQNDAHRSLPDLSALAPLWAVPGVSFVSLQKGQGEDEARQPAPERPIVALGAQIEDFADSAAIIAQLDLVICVDTAVAHLAGALGKPCWVLLPAYRCDWRWLQDRTDSPWYPEVMRLFRQATPGDWRATVGAVAAALRAWAAAQVLAHQRAAVDAHQAGQLADAEAGYRRALALRPDDAQTHYNLGLLLQQIRRLPQAEAAYRRALELQPDHTAAHNDLGNLLQHTGRLAAAESSYRSALAVRPDFAEANNNLGNLLLKVQRLPEAAAAYRRALELQPERAEAHYNLGNLLQQSQRPAEAEAAYRRALELKPDYAEACNNLASLLGERQRPAEAEAFYRRALELQPDHAEARCNLGLLLLGLGRYDEGWSCYESRASTHPGLPCPPWQGQDLTGKSLVICPEQGYGDYIQFARYAALLKARGVSRLTLVCAAPLRPLLETLDGVEVLLDSATIPPHDFWCFPLSLPLHFGTTLATIPGELPYLRAKSALATRWRQHFPQDGLKVGLVWQGRAAHPNDAYRSLPALATLASLWAVPGIRFVSLQKGQGEEEARQPPAGQAIVALGEQIEDFADSAAIISQLDLLICVDTAVAHLAGALGKPCWVLLPAVGSDWRWLRQGSDSPWYPGALRLFRQSRADDWSETVATVATALEVWATNDATAVAERFRAAFAAHQENRLSDAESGYRAILSQLARHADAMHLLGVIQQQKGRLAEAETLMRQALEQRPQASFFYNLGLVLHQAQRLPEAEAAYRRALQLKPDYAKVYCNLGNLLEQTQRLAEAEVAWRRALELQADFAEASHNLSLLLLSLGRYAEAWSFHEQRYRYAHGLADAGIPELPFPQWQGESLNGKSLLIWPEQGFGDYLQFVRYAPLLKARGVSRLTLVCAWPLKDLLETVAGVDEVIDLTSPAPRHDFWSFPLSLPLYFGTTLATIPATLPYLGVPPRRAQRWHARLPQTGLKVGLAWQGSARHSNDAQRSLPGLATLAPLWSVPGVSFVSLHKGQGGEQAAPGLPIVALGAQIEDFADTAAIIAQLDLLICVDTAVAHLAGALGKPCWVLLPARGTDWRWLRDRADSPWYPEVMRLFRQSVAGDWSQVVDQVLAALETWTASATTAPVVAAAAASSAPPPAALFQTALAAHQAGQTAAAERGYRQLLSLAPQHADALHLLGVIEQQKGRPAQAEVLIRQALALREDAAYLGNLGIVLHAGKRLARAEAAYRRALQLQPDYADAYCNLGLLLGDAKRPAAAEAAYRRALQLKPGYVDAHIGLGNLLCRDTKRISEAEAAYRRALEWQPRHAKAHNNLGTLLKQTWRLTEAEAAYRRALQLDPEYADAHCNLAMLLLGEGRYAAAWPHYEYRYRGAADAVPDLAFPQWQGEPLGGKSLLVWAEQGFGDCIQFARYLPLLKQRGVSRLTLACAPSLIPLLATVDGVDAAVDTAAVSAHDFWVFPLSLPLHFGTTLATIPTALPYLSALPQRVVRWRERLPRHGLKVGLVWKGRAGHNNDAQRSLPDLAALAPLWAVPGIGFVSLQKWQAEAQAQYAPAGQPIIALGAEIEDFADSAAIVAQLDLLICVDTAVAHLAGALGKPCWVLLPARGTDWRWLRERGDSPWYPKVMRLFRQATPDDWSGAIGEVAATLRAWAATGGPAERGGA